MTNHSQAPSSTPSPPGLAHEQHFKPGDEVMLTYHSPFCSADPRAAVVSGVRDRDQCITVRSPKILHDRKVQVVAWGVVHTGGCAACASYSQALHQGDFDD